MAMRVLASSALLLVLAFCVLQLPLRSQEPDLKVSIGDLQTRLQGMETAEEVDEARKAWKDLLVQKEREIVETEEEARKASGDAKSTLDEKISVLLEERSAIIERLSAVLKIYETKQGHDEDTVKGDRQYIDNLPNHIRFTDPSALWTWLKNWVVSPEGGIKWGLNILLFVLLLFAFHILSNFGGKVASRTLRTTRLKTSDLLRDFFINTVRKVIFFVGLIIALSQIGIDIAPFLAGLGVLGFVVGFALQGTLSNFASGVMILLYRPYDIGNYIEAAGVKGTVSAMSLVSTTLTSPDNQIVVIPNGSIWNGVITNITGNPTRRVDLTFGIGYGDDAAKAEHILQEIVKAHPKVLKDPEPVIKLHELAASSVNFVVRPWTKTGDYWEVYWDITRQVKERFDAEGISIPFPQTDMHVKGLERLMEGRG